jgi:hypothetical protein
MPISAPVRLPVVVLVLAIGLSLGVVGVALLSDDTAAVGSASGPVPARSKATSARARALAVLHDWDRRRAAAWATGNEVALTRLYTARSTAGSADAALLRRYLQRGVTVTGLRMQVLRAAVFVDRPRRVVVRVTERLTPRAARVGTRSVLLPRDSAETHVVELRRIAGSWRVAAVTSARLTQ